MLDRGYQPAFVAFFGNDNLAAVAALHDYRHAIEPQVALLLQRAVAAKTSLGQDRFDIASEIDRLRGRSTTACAQPDQAGYHRDNAGGCLPNLHKPPGRLTNQSSLMVVAAKCRWQAAN